MTMKISVIVTAAAAIAWFNSENLLGNTFLENINSETFPMYYFCFLRMISPYSTMHCVLSHRFILKNSYLLHINRENLFKYSLKSYCPYFLQFEISFILRKTYWTICLATVIRNKCILKGKTLHIYLSASQRLRQLSHWSLSLFQSVILFGLIYIVFVNLIYEQANLIILCTGFKCYEMTNTSTTTSAVATIAATV